jgi:hypothetical protein
VPFPRTIRQCVFALGALLSMATGASAATLTVNSPLASLQDDRLSYTTLSADDRVRQAADLGARLIRTDIPWDLIATSRPANAKDPNDPAYDWTRMDQIVAAASHYSVQLLFVAWGTPAWAADPTITDTGGFWRRSIRPQNAADFGDFGVAAATRYGPQGVHLWEAWNEPNIPLFLQPQFANVGGKWTNVSARVYSDLAKAFYEGVKRVDPLAKVAGLVTAPVGDTCPVFCPSSPFSRTYPIDFLKLLDKPDLRPPMDAVSHHPYPQSGPRGYDFPGAGYVDLYNLSRLEKAVDASYLKGKPLWLTEVGFSTAPTEAYNTYFSKAQQAEYLADAYRRVRQDPRVKVFTWFFLQDNPDWTSGLLTAAGARKPSYSAFAFPVAPDNRNAIRRGSSVRIIGQIRVAAGSTTVTIERRVKSRWRSLTHVRTRPDGGFSVAVRPTETVALRARWTGRTRLHGAGSRLSTVFTVRVVRTG